MENAITISGLIKSEKTINNKEKLLLIAIIRISGTADLLPVRVKKAQIENIDKKQFVLVNGLIESRYIYQRTCVQVQALQILNIHQPMYLNAVVLRGALKNVSYYCRESGMQVNNMALSVGRNIIPCVAWYDNADILNTNVGTQFKIIGRFQSRDYIKNGTKKTFYEVAIKNVEEIRHEENIA